MRWTELRPIQAEAIREVLRGDRHVLISASTAGGKTEAAFLPILSSIVDDHQGGVRAVYVGPLKALINDQFRRLEDLCTLSGIPVHRWHGDVGQAAKKELRERPSGVLLITPESIESLFVNHYAHLGSIFPRLSFIVIDELHSFIGTERGAHMKSLLSRLAARSKNRVRRISLSATIGDMDAAATWMLPGEGENVAKIIGTESKTISFMIKGYLQKSGTEARVKAEEAEDETSPDEISVAEGIIKAFHGKTALIFGNSKAELEKYADLSERLLKTRGLQSGFRVHHGSLSKSEREDTEDALRSSRPTATFCSSTLEMGIDVGSVSATGQIGPPYSVNSLAQRLGRSGRREGEPSVMWMFVKEMEPVTNAGLTGKLFPDLLQAVAMTELMIERWCEPPDTGKPHLSTLIQQIMSVIAEKGGATAAYLHENLVALGAFANIEKRIFLDTLRSMGAADLIEQTPEGEIILGLQGERVVRNKDFYSAFVTPEELKVIHGSRAVGTVAAMPGLAADGYLILAGRRWKVLEIDLNRKEILVEPARGGRLPFFKGMYSADIHPRVREKMRDVLLSEKVPVYLDNNAREMLNSVRSVAREAGLKTSPFITDGRDTLWLTWTGSRIHFTLLGLGKGFLGLDAKDEDGIALSFGNISPSELIEGYKKILNNVPADIRLAEKFPIFSQEKYEPFLSGELQRYVFAKNSLDVKGAISIIEDAIK